MVQSSLFSHHVIFHIAQEMAKVNVEEVTGCCNHDVIVVAISNAL